MEAENARLEAEKLELENSRLESEWAHIVSLIRHANENKHTAVCTSNPVTGRNTYMSEAVKERLRKALYVVEDVRGATPDGHYEFIRLNNC